MQSVLRITGDGKYYADFSMDEAPPGFEDHFDESMCARRFREGRAVAEFGEPNTDGLTGDPVATLRRILCIEDRNICARMFIDGPSGPNGLFRIWVQPYGWQESAFYRAFETNPKGLALKFRCIEQPDDEGNNKVVNIPSIDVIQI